jgi:peptide/nickel transport system permease protein
MRRYLIRRSVQSIFILLGISLICFILIRAVPGGPETKFASDPRLSQADLQQIREYYGLNEPVPVQYAKWIWGVIRFDFGRSYESLRPVTAEILAVLPNTLILLAGGILLGFLGIPLGVYIARRRGKFSDNLVRVFTVIGSAVPHWWIGLLLLLAAGNFFNSTGIKIIPLPGYDPKNDNFLYFLWQLLLPWLLIALTGWLNYSRITRTQVLDVINQDYVRTANAKGMSVKQVNRWHVLRNALIPLITAFGGILPTLFSGSIIFENIFAIRGMGTLTISALNDSDYPLAMGILMFVSMLTIIGLLISDILYSVADPRVTYE